MQNAINKAIKLAGSKSALARVLDISPQALGQQIRNGGILPDHCIAIEKKFPGQITRYELDPEHFGAELPASDCVVIVLQNFQSTSKTV
jgi:DNA-binding transcriptional regulator YdaS (Cro superfamily)